LENGRDDHRKSAVWRWDSIFPDPTMTVAAIDCPVHHSIILEMNTDSYRRKSAETKSRRKSTGSAA
jgi:hypothetical protein